METKKEYKQALANNIITSDMLCDALFSVNKRAKNARDAERQYRNRRYDKYDNEQQYRDKKNELYRIKDSLLSILKPTCIHKEFLGYERYKVYDYEEYYWEARCTKNVIRTGKYFDYDEGVEVEFAVIEDQDSPLYNYYLFYVLGEHSFHTPINDIKDYAQYDVVEIDHLNTFGHDIQDLMSLQFVNKILNLIKSGEYQYIA